jgi:antitoxin component YwqK of YwqJK toxin-antitoxin module
MKQLFPAPFLFIILLIVSCSGKDNSPEAIRERLLQGEFDAYSHTQRVPCDSLDLDSLGYYRYNDSLFTGVCYENFPNQNVKLRERQIFRGQMHGHHILYTPKGDTISINLYNQGKLIRKSMGKSEVVHCDDLEDGLNSSGEEVKLYFGAPYDGSCNRYFPEPDTAQVYITIPYHQGKVDGEMIVYDKLGNILIKETYKNGEVQR